jgi:hypothetical protein
MNNSKDITGEEWQSDIPHPTRIWESVPRETLYPDVGERNSLNEKKLCRPQRDISGRPDVKVQAAVNYAEAFPEEVNEAIAKKAAKN